MKRCPRCGKGFADRASVCDVDGAELIGGRRTRTITATGLDDAPEDDFSDVETRASLMIAPTRQRADKSTEIPIFEPNTDIPIHEVRDGADSATAPDAKPRPASSGSAPSDKEDKEEAEPDGSSAGAAKDLFQEFDEREQSALEWFGFAEPDSPGQAPGEPPSPEAPPADADGGDSDAAAPESVDYEEPAAAELTPQQDGAGLFAESASPAEQTEPAEAPAPSSSGSNVSTETVAVYDKRSDTGDMLAVGRRPWALVAVAAVVLIGGGVAAVLLLGGGDGSEPAAVRAASKPKSEKAAGGKPAASGTGEEPSAARTTLQKPSSSPDEHEAQPASSKESSGGGDEVATGDESGRGAGKGRKRSRRPSKKRRGGRKAKRKARKGDSSSAAAAKADEPQDKKGGDKTKPKRYRIERTIDPFSD